MCITRRFPERSAVGRLAVAAVVAAPALLLFAASAQAQGKTSTGPAAAFAGGRAAGDPRGAVRALGSVQGSDAGRNSKAVQVPHLGGEGKDETGGTPLGTSR